MKGLIALDIDGTLTIELNSIPRQVVEYLDHLVQEGWLLVFITGRTFSWGQKILNSLTFPYYFAVQNGATILEMPERQIILKKYLNNSIFPVMEKICGDQPTDFVIYSGAEYNDVCYYRPQNFSQELLQYLQNRVEVSGEMWQKVASFTGPIVEEFSSVKCFGDEQSSFLIAKAIEEQLGLHVPVIKDPFNYGYYVVQATHPTVTKGTALRDLVNLLKYRGLIIAAGDDNNDRPMLAEAHIRVVMATAPKDLLDAADVQAPSAREFGIIQGLNQAIELIKLRGLH